ncbi:MAG: opacity protein-like surface antigen [Kiritimatiellia bacterium]|jgi:opacity protein-like surface antigen
MKLQRTILLSTLLALTGVVAVSAVPTTALAQADKQAERLRLEEEMKKLAQRNAWAGVERKYTELVALKLDLPFGDHQMGAQSAKFLGKTYEVYTRLELAMKKKASDGIATELKALDAGYGRIDLQGSEKFLPAVVPAVMPFAPDQRKSIEWATTVMTNTGSFKGMLPVGKYTVAGQDFEVIKGKNFLIRAVKKLSKKELKVLAEKTGQTVETEGLIVYNGPLVTVGYNFMLNTEASEPVFDKEYTDFYSAQAQTNSGSGLGLHLGYEVGFTSMLGVAATVGYNGMIGGKTTPAQGTASFNGGTAWLAATVRPGDLRIAFGPSMNMYYGQGTGVACWFELNPNAGEDWDVAPDGDDDCGYPSDPRYAPNLIPWRGLSVGPGASMSIGYGLMDVAGLQGVVQLDGSWATDGERNFINVGLRVGFVPFIERFKG